MSSISLGSDKNGVLLPVRVKPRGRANTVEGVRNNALMVSVTAAPADGAANAAVIEVVAKALGCPRSTLEIIRGHKARDKTIRIEGLLLDEVRARIETLL